MSKLTSNPFSSSTVDEWEKLALKTIKSDTIEALQTKTYENITLHPIYTIDAQGLDEATIPPGVAPFVRGVTNPKDQKRPWKVAQWLQQNSSESLVQQVATLKEKGQDVISFKSSDFSPEELKEWKESIESLPLLDVLIELQKNEVDWVSELKGRKGFIGYDPIKIMIENDEKEEELETYYSLLGNGIKENSTGLKHILVDNTIFHNSGADLVTELACVLSVAAEHVDRLEGKNLSADSILSNMLVRIGVAGSFFVEVAKIRALRYLWYKFTSAYNTKSEESRKITIVAETSYVTKTIYDEYVNVLRSGNEAFAAVTAGVDYLHVTPFDLCLKDKKELAERIARNTQHLLAEESRLSHVMDPAGGSWYVEFLTKELADNAWKLFLEIEDRGGIVACIETGWIQERIRKVRDEKIKAAMKREIELVGTNVFVDGNDRKPQESLPINGQRLGFPLFRLSEVFEKWRLYFNQHPVKVAIIGLGTIKEYKERRDLARNWFASAGIMTTFFEGIDSLDTQEYKAICICGTNESYQNWEKAYGEDSLPIPVFSAGRPTELESIKTWIYPELPLEEVVSAWVTEGVDA